MASWGSPAPGYFPRSPGNQYSNTRETPPRFPQNSNVRQIRGRNHGNAGFSPGQNQNPRQYQPYQQEFFKSPTSPQHRHFSPNGPNIFRTPQPVIRTPPMNTSWNDRSHTRSSPKRFQMKSPRYDHYSNAGGSFNIESYYHKSMLDDPWRDLIPVPVTRSPSTTT